MSREGRIHARPSPVTQPAPAGLHTPDVDTLRGSYVYVPPSYRVSEPGPLLVLLHGSGGHALHGLELLQHLADEANFILLAPVSTDYTWDIVVSRYGPDVRVVGEALEYAFATYAIDPSHLAIGGFSDGASYALSLGLTNGDLFTHIIAFSPGFVMPRAIRGNPRIFISHGTRDEILTISECSRRIVPQLEHSGLEVEYVEFEAGHRIPPEIARQAIEWFTRAGASPTEARRVHA